MKQKHRLFCPYCGANTVKRREEETWRVFVICNVFFYDNPLPVVPSLSYPNRKILLVSAKEAP